MGAYDDCQWQWISDACGPMGWFTNIEKREHEGSSEFTNGHWRRISQEERDVASADYTQLVREQS